MKIIKLSEIKNAIWDCETNCGKVHESYISAINCRNNGKWHRLTPENQERMEQILNFRENGKTFREIASLIGISLNRVRQINSKAVNLINKTKGKTNDKT